jgi:hypothetical protein
MYYYMSRDPERNREPLRLYFSRTINMNLLIVCIFSGTILPLSLLLIINIVKAEYLTDFIIRIVLDRY